MPRMIDSKSYDSKTSINRFSIVTPETLHTCNFHMLCVHHLAGATIHVANLDIDGTVLLRTF